MNAPTRNPRSALKSSKLRRTLREVPKKPLRIRKPNFALARKIMRNYKLSE